MSARSLLAVLRRDRVLLVLLVVAGVAAGGAVGLLQPREYEATATGSVSESGVHLDGLQKGNELQRQVMAAYADVARTPIVLNRVIQELDLPTTAPRLAESVHAVVPDGTVMIRVSAADRSSPQAARIANAVVSNLSRAADQLSPEPSADRIRITLVRGAKAAAIPTFGALPVDLLAGFAAGLVLATVILLVRERTSR